MQADPSRHYVPPVAELMPISAPHNGLRLHHLMLVVLAWALILLTALIGGIPGSVGGIVLAMAGLAGINVILSRRRVSQQDALLGVLAIAAEGQMPLGPAVEAFADACGGRYRHRVGRLARLLNSGVPLPDALDGVPRVVPPDAMVLIRVGSDAGLLPGALREAAETRASRPHSSPNPMPRFLYLVLVLVVMQVISGYVLYFIVPKFEAIFRDFGVDLPPMTIFVIHASHAVVNTPLLPILFLVEFLLFVHLPSSYFGWWSGYAPWLDRILLSPFDRLLVRKHSALVLRALARGIEAGGPLSRVLGTLAQRHPSGWVRERLRRVLWDVEKGTDCWSSLRDHGLIRPADAAVLEAARRVGNLPWALRETAESGERRLGYRLQFWLQMLFPVVVVAMGGLVFVLATAFFLPLIRLIEALAP